MNPVLLIVPILLPIVCGGALLLRPGLSDRARNCFVETAACVNSVLVFLLLASVREETATVYSFISGFSVGLRADGCAKLFAGMVSFMWPLALLYAFDYMREAARRNSFFAFYLMTYGVALGVAFASNLVTMYVFFEMLTLVTIPLVTHFQDPDSVAAGWLYAGYCVAGASLAFIAVVIGTLDGTGDFIYGSNLGGEYAPGLMRTVYLFGFFGFGVKAALFPFFQWLIRASVAPTPVTALLHAVAVVNSGVYAVIRLTWYAFGPDLLRGSGTQTVCILFASFSLVFAAAMALKERHFKRRLAYSTMSNLSYILLGVTLLTPQGLYGALSHMLFHGVIKMSLFLCAGAFMHVTGNEYLYEVDGVGRRMPLTFACYTLGALSLSGVPLFCGFLSKWRLLTAAVDLGTRPALLGAVSLVAAAFLCAIYTLSVSIRAFFPIGDGKLRYPGGVREADWRMLVPIGVFTVLNVLFGVWSGPVSAFLSSIAWNVM